MLKWCKEKFEGACNAMAIFSLILSSALCAFVGGYSIAQTLRERDSKGFFIFFGIIIGLVLAIIGNVLFYGFAAVVIDIKDTLHAINSHNCENGKDTQIINSRDCESATQKMPKAGDNYENSTQKTPDDTLQKIVKANDATESQSQNRQNKKDEEYEYSLKYDL